MRITKALPSECPACHGMGFTEGSATEMEMVFNAEMNGYVEVRTLAKGSGCWKCHGTGQLP